MKKLLGKLLTAIVFFVCIGFFSAQKAQAASFVAVSDTISTSRPSAAAPITANINANDISTTVIDNGSIYLASDSAQIYADNGMETGDFGVNVASMSAQLAGPTRNIYFTAKWLHSHHLGNAVVVNITATHTIKITTNDPIVSGGHILITFPAASSNIASPSASGFSLNGLTSANMATFVQCNPTTACGGGGQSISGSTITLTTTAAQGASGQQVIYIAVGCQTAVSAAGVCTAPNPILINPTKLATAGTSDQWKILIQSSDTGGIIQDSSKALIATIESVQVQALVEPSLTFTIAGLANATNYNDGSTTTQCGSETSKSGIDSTATTVNLGILNNARINTAAQKLTVTTNGSTGYSITATSSGHLLNPVNGVFITDANLGSATGLSANDTPIPAAITAATPAFGISPCGADVPTTTPNWGGTGQTTSVGALFSNPWNSGNKAYYATIATESSGPSNGDSTHGITIVRYGATVSGTTPAGIYSTVFTYVASASF
jgi:hypothetical protein